MKTAISILCSLAITACADGGSAPPSVILADDLAAAGLGARVIKLSPLSGQALTNGPSGGFQISEGRLTGGWSPDDDRDFLAVPVQLVAGERIEAAYASVYGARGIRVLMSLVAHSDAFHAGGQLVVAQSELERRLQTLELDLDREGLSDEWRVVSAEPRSYWLAFSARVIKTGEEGAPIVGPIVVVTSTVGEHR
jgi:hypothetical protein